MYRATTPIHTFVFDVDPEETFKEILISYAQDGTVLLEKTKEDLTVVEKEDSDGNKYWEASVRLTQEETNKFSAQSGVCLGSQNAVKTVDIQVRALTYADEAVASEKMMVIVKDVLNDEVLT